MTAYQKSAPKRGARSRDPEFFRAKAACLEDFAEGCSGALRRKALTKADEALGASQEAGARYQELARLRVVMKQALRKAGLRPSDVELLGSLNPRDLSVGVPEYAGLSALLDGHPRRVRLWAEALRKAGYTRWAAFLET